ncbi:hypothetical protein LLG88_05795 [bacterium]|nr:hypothetical protein [bacterium]
MNKTLGCVWDDAEDGALAMARDEATLEALQDGAGLDFLLRAHRWATPTVTLGRAQAVPPELLADAREAGVRIARRPTGGGWLLHLPGDLALTFAVRGPLGPGDLRTAARRTAQGIAAGLTACGAPALVFGGMAQPATRAEVCFMRADRDEVLVGETKVAGVALARFGRSALVQSALPLVSATPELRAFAGRWDPKRDEAAAASASPDHRALWSAAAAELSRLLRAEAREWAWPEADAARAVELLASKYARDEFTVSGRI